MIKLNSASNMQNSFIHYDSYANLAKNRIIFLTDNVTTQGATDLSALIISLDMENNTDFITLYINTNGGDLSGLIQIYDTLQLVKSPIKTVCLSKCYSAGAIILAAGEKGSRYILKSAKVMIHGIQCLFPLPGTDVVNSKNYFEFLDKSNENMLKILAKHTGKSFNKIKNDCLRDTYLSAQEAVDYGLVDKIVA